MADSTTTPSTAAAPVVETPSSPTVAAAPDNANTTTAVGAPTAEVDEGFEENDSAYGEEQSAYTASLTSTIKNHTFENGRRYAGYQPSDGSTGYLAPNDDAENDRMDMHHHLSALLIGGGLVTAPIGPNPQRILDIGTGTGIWAIEAGDEYPSAQVIGVDLSPTQPSMVPPNVKFEIDDVEQPWTYNEKFDYIHSRFMAGSISNWQRYVDQIFKHTKPGGWAEFKDWDLSIRTGDGSLPADHPVMRYHNLMYQSVMAVGRDYMPGPSIKDWCSKAGFVRVQEKIEAAPLGLWPKDKRYKEIGAWNMLCLTEGLEGIIMRLFTEVLGMTKEEVLVFVTDVRKGLKDKSIHAQYTYYIITAQKPGGPDDEEEVATETEVEAPAAPPAAASAA